MQLSLIGLLSYSCLSLVCCHTAVSHWSAVIQLSLIGLLSYTPTEILRLLRCVQSGVATPFCPYIMLSLGHLVYAILSLHHANIGSPRLRHSVIMLTLVHLVYMSTKLTCICLSVVLYVLCFYSVNMYIYICSIYIFIVFVSESCYLNFVVLVQ